MTREEHLLRLRASPRYQAALALARDEHERDRISSHVESFVLNIIEAVQPILSGGIQPATGAR